MCSHSTVAPAATQLWTWRASANSGSVYTTDGFESELAGATSVEDDTWYAQADAPAPGIAAPRYGGVSTKANNSCVLATALMLLTTFCICTSSVFTAKSEMFAFCSEISCELMTLWLQLCTAFMFGISIALACLPGSRLSIFVTARRLASPCVCLRPPFFSGFCP